ncbi:MAG: HD domain-containing protein, partial [Clostridiales bacterium]|nr:HD domain-containing protein [Clostridiales bacterium]
IKVYTYAKVIGECEGLSEHEQIALETAAILHDIACPLCRKKYGNTNGKYQEIEGAVLAGEFLQDTDFPPELAERVIFLVSHHHTYTDIDGLDCQILLEADYLVNADEANYSKDNIRNMLNTLFKTSTGIALLKSIYHMDN